MMEFDPVARSKCPRCKNNDDHLGFEIAGDRIRPPPEERLHVAGTVRFIGVHHFKLALGERMGLREKAVVHILSCGVNEPLGLRAQSLEKTHRELRNIVGDNPAGTFLDGFEAPGWKLSPV
jgi:hypothetical protein